MEPLRGGGPGAWLRGAMLVLLLAALSGCSTTGESFRSAGLDRIVAGRTTFAQAVEDLGAEPVNTWQQGDTLLARWAYKGTVATDAVYFRQEVWLRFGPDGRFIRTERAINVPPQHHTRTAQETNRETIAPASVPADGAAPGMPAGAAQPLPVPLLPAGTLVIPGPSYPIEGAGQ